MKILLPAILIFAVAHSKKLEFEDIETDLMKEIRPKMVEFDINFMRDHE